jgi:hypothetical protein
MEYRRLNYVGWYLAFPAAPRFGRQILVCVDLLGFSEARLLAVDLPGRSQHPPEGLLPLC